ncbi:MAG: DNA alkylation repair protein [Thermoleophilia bacterium]
MDNITVIEKKFRQLKPRFKESIRINTSELIISRLRELGDRDRAVNSQRFFKTGKGEYGEGDQFLGIRVPVLRKCAREYKETGLEDVLKLLRSPLHEARLLALFMMTARFSKSDGNEKQTIYRVYLGHTKYINNWDLVDSSAEHIVGAYLSGRDRKPLYRLVRSKSLWERRISIMSTFRFIKQGEFADTLALAQLLLDDNEDLIHKAAGWMLREVGNRNMSVEEAFLAKNYGQMPRTMLRYAIEKFPEVERQAYLHGDK